MMPKGCSTLARTRLALSVERPVRAVKASASVGLAMHPPLDAFFFYLLFSSFVRIGLVAVDRLLPAMQTGIHLLCVVDRGGRGRNAVHPSLRIAAHVGLHAKMPGVALLRAGHLGVPLPFDVIPKIDSHLFIDLAFEKVISAGT